MSSKEFDLFNSLPDSEREAERSDQAQQNVQSDKKVTSVRLRISQQETLIRVIVQSQRRYWHRRTREQVVEALRIRGLDQSEINFYINKFQSNVTIKGKDKNKNEKTGA